MKTGRPTSRWASKANSNLGCLAFFGIWLSLVNQTSGNVVTVAGTRVNNKYGTGAISLDHLLKFLMTEMPRATRLCLASKALSSWISSSAVNGVFRWYKPGLQGPLEDVADGFEEPVLKSLRSPGKDEEAFMR